MGLWNGIKSFFGFSVVDKYDPLKQPRKNKSINPWDSVTQEGSADPRNQVSEQENWELKTKRMTRTGWMLAAMIVVGAGATAIYTTIATEGHQYESTPTVRQAHSPSSVDNAKLTFMTSQSNKLLFVDGQRPNFKLSCYSSSGTKLWDTDAIKSSQYLMNSNTQLIEHNRTLILISRKFIFGLDSDSGKLLWRVPAATEWRINHYYPIKNNILLMFDKNKFATGVDLTTGERIWTNNLNLSYMPTRVFAATTSDGFVYLDVNATKKYRGVLRIVDTKSGKTLRSPGPSVKAGKYSTRYMIPGRELIKTQNRYLIPYSNIDNSPLVFQEVGAEFKKAYDIYSSDQQVKMHYFKIDKPAVENSKYVFTIAAVNKGQGTAMVGLNKETKKIRTMLATNNSDYVPLYASEDYLIVNHSQDGYANLSCIDIKGNKVIWEKRLGQATPVGFKYGSRTYAVNVQGREVYVAIPGTIPKFNKYDLISGKEELVASATSGLGGVISLQKIGSQWIIQADRNIYRVENKKLVPVYRK